MPIVGFSVCFYPIVSESSILQGFTGIMLKCKYWKAIIKGCSDRVLIAENAQKIVCDARKIMHSFLRSLSKKADYWWE